MGLLVTLEGKCFSQDFRYTNDGRPMARLVLSQLMKYDKKNYKDSKYQRISVVWFDDAANYVAVRDFQDKKVCIPNVDLQPLSYYENDEGDIYINADCWGNYSRPYMEQEAERDIEELEEEEEPPRRKKRASSSSRRKTGGGKSTKRKKSSGSTQKRHTSKSKPNYDDEDVEENEDFIDDAEEDVVVEDNQDNIPF